MSWVGYKVHLTESCDDEDLPNLITSVRTIVAAATDAKQLRAIQEGLSRSETFARRAAGGRRLRL
jgi:transposase